MNKIIAISGKLGSGKDTLANLIQQVSTEHWEITAFAKRLKEIVALLAGVSYESTLSQEGKNLQIPEFGMTIGEMLQKIGTNALRDNFHKEVWVQSVFSQINKSTSNWIITDCRFENEAKAVIKNGGYVIRIDRPINPIAINSGRDLNHPSETGLDHFDKWSYRITNDGTIDQLKKKIIQCLNTLNLPIKEFKNTIAI